MTSLSRMAPGSSGHETAAATAEREPTIDIIVEKSYWESARPQPGSGGDCGGNEAMPRFTKILNTAPLKPVACHRGFASCSDCAAGPARARSSSSFDGDFDINGHDVFIENDVKGKDDIGVDDGPLAPSSQYR